MLMAEPGRMRTARLEPAWRAGFEAFKIGWGPFGRVDARTDEAIVAAARDAVGPDVELMVDAGGSDAFWPHGYKWAIDTGPDAGQLRRRSGSRRRCGPTTWKATSGSPSTRPCRSRRARC